MRRTRRRALPRHIVSPRSALVFGLILGVLSTLMLYLLVNPLSAALALAANVFYVVGYTMILKRRTTQNIVWGGAAGCFPALIGWTAVTGELAWAPVVLFLVVFFWTPPHFWALAIRYREDYAAAEVPMLPVVAGAKTVARQIVAYLCINSLGYKCADGYFTDFTTSKCSWSSRTAVAAPRTPTMPRAEAMRLFHWSNMYLSLPSSWPPRPALTADRYGVRPRADGSRGPAPIGLAKFSRAATNQTGASGDDGTVQRHGRGWCSHHSAG
jgi:protoheme IX farnesyltransferase